MTNERPWLKFYDGYPGDFEVPDTTLYEQIAQSAARRPELTAMIFMGRQTSYTQLLAEIDRCAAALTAHGIKAGDSVLLAMPNIPNAVFAFYALNRIGARAVMTHPLSAPAELKHYYTLTGSRWIITVDMFWGRIEPILDELQVEQVLICRIPDYLSPALKAGFALTKGRKIAALPKDRRIIRWTDFIKSGQVGEYVRVSEPADGAAVLFSGGTTSLPKGIELSSAAFNATAISAGYITGFSAGHSVLAIMPIFHGFGLGLCIHTAFLVGACSILVPEFSAKIYIENLIKYKPSFIAGVPTLFQALLLDPNFSKVDFSQLVGAYSGGDSLTADMKHRFDAAIQAQGSTVELVEGYGLTETVTTCALSPKGFYRDNSMGVPNPGIDIKIVDVESGHQLPPGENGEICVTGPQNMNCYVGDPEATAFAMRTHADGKVWVHTGDIGWMDADGYLYFVNRLKRVIKVSGVAVYPMQVEQVLEAHPRVWRACVIGVPDDYQMHSVKAFVILDDKSAGDDELRQELIKHCRESLNKWAIPREIEFRPELPTTLVGKIAYTELEKEEAERRAA